METHLRCSKCMKWSATITIAQFLESFNLKVRASFFLVWFYAGFGRKYIFAPCIVPILKCPNYLKEQKKTHQQQTHFNSKAGLITCNYRIVYQWFERRSHLVSRRYLLMDRCYTAERCYRYNTENGFVTQQHVYRQTSDELRSTLPQTTRYTRHQVNSIWIGRRYIGYTCTTCEMISM